MRQIISHCNWCDTFWRMFELLCRCRRFVLPAMWENHLCASWRRLALACRSFYATFRNITTFKGDAVMAKTDDFLGWSSQLAKTKAYKRNLVKELPTTVVPAPSDWSNFIDRWYKWYNGANGIGLFTDSYRPSINGIVYVVESLKRRLEALGHEVYVFVNQSLLVRPSKPDFSTKMRIVE